MVSGAVCVCVATLVLISEMILREILRLEPSIVLISSPNFSSQAWKRHVMKAYASYGHFARGSICLRHPSSSMWTPPPC